MRKPASKPEKSQPVQRIGTKIEVSGERGNWSVRLSLEIDGRLHWSEVRLGIPGRLECAEAAKFQSIEHRETAREIRDAIQTQMSRCPDYPIWASLSDERIEGTNVVRPFVNKSWAVVEFRASDFDYTWKLPKSFPTLVGRKA
jgi:hypothetical protein